MTLYTFGCGTKVCVPCSKSHPFDHQPKSFGKCIGSIGAPSGGIFHRSHRYRSLRASKLAFEQTTALVHKLRLQECKVQNFYEYFISFVNVIAGF